jgi:hypothetical protein
MPIPSFPFATTAFGAPSMSSGFQIPITTGNYWFVSSLSGSNGNNGGTASAPFATLKYALTRCLTNNLDVVILMPGHTESTALTTDWTAPAGTSICGIGVGTLRPLLSFTATTATMTVSANNVTLQNVVLQTGISEVVSCLTVSGTDFTMNGVGFVEHASNYTVISVVTTTNAATRFTMINSNMFLTTACAGTGAGVISLVGTDSSIINDNLILANRPNAATAGILVGATTAHTKLTLLRNTFGSLATGTNTVGISLVAASTGIAAYNTVANLGKTAIAGSVGTSNLMCVNNYAIHTVNKSGLLDPVVDA